MFPWHAATAQRVGRAWKKMATIVAAVCEWYREQGRSTELTLSIIVTISMSINTRIGFSTRTSVLCTTGDVETSEIQKTLSFHGSFAVEGGTYKLSTRDDVLLVLGTFPRLSSGVR